MSSPTTQLWAPKPQRPAQNAVDSIDRTNMIPGTWLKVVPSASPSFNANRFLQLTPTTSPLPSPSMKGENVSPVDLTDLSLNDSLPRPKTERFLSNTSSASRQSSFSSASGSISTRPPAFLTVPSVERREMAIGRLGGVGGAFLSN